MMRVSAVIPKLNQDEPQTNISTLKSAVFRLHIIPPIPELEHERFWGGWYMREGTSTRWPCWTHPAGG